MPLTQSAAARFEELVTSGLDRLPRPGHGDTLLRWRALATVAGYDLSLVKLYEGHTDALAILAELGGVADGNAHDTWGVWAAEPPGVRVMIEPLDEGAVRLRGRKPWCSGAAHVSHGLLTAWHADGQGPQLVRVTMQQAGVSIDATAWQAVGMAGSSSVDVTFDGARADAVGTPGAYLARPGFWHGGAGIAACWHGAACALGAALWRRLNASTEGGSGHAFQLAALGRIDLHLRSSAALLTEAAAWVDRHPNEDASEAVLRVRLAAEQAAARTLEEVGRALGATPFCRDAHFAQLAADLPVFIRQSHAERDLAALGERVALQSDTRWLL